MSESEKRTELIQIRTTPTIKALVQKLAQKDNRTVTNLIENWILHAAKELEC